MQHDAQKQADGVTPDKRATSKTLPTPPLAYANVTGTLKWNIYKSPEDGDPIIRNEELSLLRAEARWFSGDKTGALQDIDYVRTTSGGLQPAASIGLTIASPDLGFVDELLYNRRYSLMWEGAHRWIDVRRFDRITDLPLDDPMNDVRNVRYPIPLNECNARPNEPACSLGSQ